MTFYKLNKKYKDRIFRLIFHDKAELLKLYNALNNSHYTNPDDLIITTIDDVVYMGMKNDLSFIISNMMNLYEHPSTFSPNLPLRGLFYLASLYRTYVDSFKINFIQKQPFLFLTRNTSSFTMEQWMNQNVRN